MGGLLDENGAFLLSVPLADGQYLIHSSVNGFLRVVSRENLCKVLVGYSKSRDCFFLSADDELYHFSAKEPFTNRYAYYMKFRGGQPTPGEAFAQCVQVWKQNRKQVPGRGFIYAEPVDQGSLAHAVLLAEYEQRTSGKENGHD